MPAGQQERAKRRPQPCLTCVYRVAGCMQSQGVDLFDLSNELYLDGFQLQDTHRYSISSLLESEEEKVPDYNENDNNSNDNWHVLLQLCPYSGLT